MYVRYLIQVKSSESIGLLVRWLQPCPWLICMIFFKL